MKAVDRSYLVSKMTRYGYNTFSRLHRPSLSLLHFAPEVSRIRREPCRGANRSQSASSLHARAWQTHDIKAHLLKYKGQERQAPAACAPRPTPIMGSRLLVLIIQYACIQLFHVIQDEQNSRAAPFRCICFAEDPVIGVERCYSFCTRMIWFHTRHSSEFRMLSSTVNGSI
jgi:hypothetical protein